MAASVIAPSMFNDVLGPVMRGPSSSHCAASNRIGRLCRDLMNGDLQKVVIDYDPSGSLATTHEPQGTDMGLYGGFLGWEPDDPRLPDYSNYLSKEGLETEVRYVDYGAQHPNTYKLLCKASTGEQCEVIAMSVGGGAISVTKIDGCEVDIIGDAYEAVLFLKPSVNRGKFLKSIKSKLSRENCIRVNGNGHVAILSFSEPVSEELHNALSLDDRVEFVRVLNPVLPVLTQSNLSVPFQSVEEMLAYRDREGRELHLWELAIAYESARGGMSADEVIDKVRALLAIMQRAIDKGLAGTSYDDRILPCQAVNFTKRHAAGDLIPGDASNLMIANITAILEVKSSMGVIVAAPTAGSCGAMPGSVLAVAEILQASEEAKIKAFLSAGMIGVFIATHATFAAELGGCMAECGSASGMAAAAMIELKNGTLEQQLSAASQALQNSFGMICDPIANRVEAPCLGKNVMAGANALSCANMAIADYQHLIPLDEVIKAMDAVGKLMPHEVRCTGKGGLSITDTSKNIERRLKSC